MPRGLKYLNGVSLELGNQLGKMWFANCVCFLLKVFVIDLLLVQGEDRPNYLEK